MIKRSFIIMITSIYKEIEKETINIALSGIFYKKNLNRIQDKLKEKISPIIDDMFKQGMQVSNKIVKQEMANLADDYRLPIKYNKDLLNTFNTDKSIFTGFFDANYKQEFTKGEIDKLKRVILQANYNNSIESEAIKNIQDTIKVSKNRARVIARQESARLDTAAKSIYYDNKKVKDKYNKVWRTVGDSNVRDEHKLMEGQIADQDGWFTLPDGNKVIGPPIGFGDRCRVQLELKN